MTTHVDGASPSVTDPDDDESGTDVGSEWVRAEMLRRMAANRSARGRHARRGEVVGAAPLHRDGPTLPPEPERLRSEEPPSAVAGYASSGDLPENYVPRHSVQTPGPAADPAPPVSGPIPVVPPNGAATNGAAANGAATNGATELAGRPHGGDAPAPGRSARGSVGGPSLTAAGLPIRMRRNSGAGASPDVGGFVPAGPWSRPGPIVPDEPVRRLGAPPQRLGDRQPVPPWGAPPAAPEPAAAEPAAPEPAALPSLGEAEPLADGDTDESPAVTSVPATGAAALRVVPPAPAPAPAAAPDTAAPDTASNGATPLRAVPPTTEVAPQVPSEAGRDAARADAARAEVREAPAEVTDEMLPGLADTPTAPHPIVLARRAAMSGRLVGVPAQRSSEQVPAVAPRALTPRHIPVVGTEPAEPGSTRVRVVLSERKGVARAVRTIKEVQEGTAVGELLLRNLIRSQLRVTLRFALLTALVLGILPATFSMLPQVSRFHVLGLHLPWVLLGVLMYPFLVGVAWRYTRAADGEEQNFADHVQD